MMKKSCKPIVLALLIAGLSDGCRKTDNPIAPNSPTGVPNGTYEALPSDRHYLIAADGSKTSMWARLLAEPSPARGSTVITGSANNCANCLRGLSLEVGVEGIPNPATTTPFSIGFSDEGVSESAHLTTMATRGNTTLQTDPNQIRSFTSHPKYILVQGSFNGDNNGPNDTFPGQSGSITILVDYK